MPHRTQRRVRAGTSLGVILLVSALLHLGLRLERSFAGGTSSSPSANSNANARSPGHKPRPRPGPDSVLRMATAVAEPPSVGSVDETETETGAPEAIDKPEVEAQAEVEGEPLPPVSERPGTRDSESFHEGDSVEFWREFNASEYPGVSPSVMAQDLDYWSYHIGRASFFAYQGVASLVWAAVQDGKPVVPKFLESATQAPVQTLERLRRTTSAVFAQDLDYIKQGYFKKPYDMQPRHRQFSPSYFLDKSLRYMQESTKTLRRTTEKSSTEPWVQQNTKLYPEYYRHTFHYQSDGWLSSESAAVYETSTETLFVGTQDAMQRTTLVHMKKHLQSQGFPADGAGVRVLEIACGTGRFMTFIRDNWPGMDVTASDLSPFYLEEARKNNDYWEDQFAPRSRSGSSTFVQANAEDLPFEASSFDMVVSVYLFHELPLEAQDAVFAEVARVLAPGGVFVLTDSSQLGDRPKDDHLRGRFGDFAEPYYNDYLRRDFAKLARSHGLTPVAKELSQATKSLSFVKPMEEPQPETQKSAA